MTICMNCGKEAEIHMCEDCANFYDEVNKKLTYDKIHEWVKNCKNIQELLQLNATLNARYRELIEQ